ncbi:acetylglutamate kinase [Saccharicrinis fermentans]|uniref:Acetylglutamate kinase n=1 Tax=Saccharicrinis fermentans DSM 9555 = JCM 21142 TaxID=869213 RepID=W7Y998_9BACT|nr:acetylglutamate kinase [Saccharicrinis fermentans]GAF04902.1 acetylglutamate kinase [Saccharicrinis fermentans DSM 9555 = JCM 21142]
MQKITIVKVGGKVVETPESLQELLHDFAALQGHKILVHGGGRSATKIAKQLGIETQMVDGRRITDLETLKVVTMVYAGLVNKNIVASLQAKGVNSVGLTGADLNLITAIKRPVKDIDYGYVGDVKSVQIKELTTLIQRDVVPVIAPLTHDGKGNMLNTNADTMASSLASALTQEFDVQLIYCFEKKGVLSNPDDDDTVITNLTYKLFKQYQESGTIAAGMIPKLDNGFNALTNGVKKVMITNTQGLKEGIDTGTILTNES